MPEKSAEEWLTETDVSHPNTDLIEFINDIQRNAKHAAMLEAAEIAEGETFSAGKHTEWETAYDKGCKDCSLSILTAAKKYED